MDPFSPAREAILLRDGLTVNTPLVTRLDPHAELLAGAGEGNSWKFHTKEPRPVVPGHNGNEAALAVKLHRIVSPIPHG